MIHQVYLSQLTLNRLTDIVKLQMHLLSYAASTSEFGEESCIEHLSHCGSFRDHSEEIVAWIWNAPTSRRGQLQSFAECNDSTDVPTQIEERRCKQAWARRLYQETLALSKNQNILIEEVFDEKTAPSWQKAGAKFLVNFYDELCSKTNLPACLFTETHISSFGRQEFLKEFMNENSNLYVCPVCDGSAYYTMVHDVIYTDIDHYLPKSLYPHFSCHPYNLIPICLICNERIKGKRDPLSGPNNQRRRLHEIFLPYREKPGLGYSTYVEAGFDKGENDEQRLYFKKLVPYEEASDLQSEESLVFNASNLDNLQKTIDALADVYEIPQRWEPDKVGETLFRRMRQFLQGNEAIILGDSTLKDDARVVLINVLDQLSYYFHDPEEGDRGKDPLTVAMASLLAMLINEELEMPSSSQDGSPLIQEITDWFKENSENSVKQAQLARKLREIIRKKNASSSNSQNNEK
jgi:hypothetical protein